MRFSSTWPRATLPEATDFLDRQRRPVKVGDRAKMRGSIPYYGASGVVDYVNDYLFDEDLILLGEDGENILSRVVPLAFMITGKSWVNNHAHVLRPREGFDIGYLTAYLESLDYSGLNSGTAQPKLNRKSCSTISVVKPPLNEQRTIAAALGDVDDVIATLQQLLAKKRATKQGMMQQLLTGETRLPGFTEPWREVSVLELANGNRQLFNDGDWIESPYITSAGNRLLQTGNIGVGRLVDVGTKRYVSDDSLAELKCKEVVPGDILICRLADPAGRACIVTDIGEKRMLTSVDVTIFRPDLEKADRRFLVSAFSTPEWFQRVSESCGGSTRTRIARSELGRMTIRLPSIQEQTRIADVLTDQEQLITLLERRLQKARSMKHGMMQELLTGRTRLPVAEGAS